jgi:regulator of protease activity HflC (stomatin/prohibitin superfamily)
LEWGYNSWIYWSAASAGRDCYIHHGKGAGDPGSGTGVERAWNELATTQAEAAKKIAEAEGDAQSAINQAKGEAESNRIRLASLTPQMLELRKLENQRALIEKWNGQLSTVESQGNGSGLLLQLPKQ